jgi:hypothetical protein
LLIEDVIEFVRKRVMDEVLDSEREVDAYGAMKGKRAHKFKGFRERSMK